ncbi:MAG: site-specific integrase [Clostridia bacterium]|nr:MAG: site-specific integrase [Clostridia bacterium]
MRQAKNKLSFGEAYHDLDLVCCLEDGSPINPGTLANRWQAISRRLNLGVRFHDLRHTHATLLLQLGERPKVVSQRLGHSSIEITMDLYSHVTPGMQKEAARRLEEFLFGGKAAK